MSLFELPGSSHPGSAWSAKRTMPKRSSKGRLDLNQLAKRIVDEATGEAPPVEQKPDKIKAAQEFGRLGGLKGGAARAAKLTQEQRSAIAKTAAGVRWKKLGSLQFEGLL